MPFEYDIGHNLLTVNISGNQFYISPGDKINNCCNDILGQAKLILKAVKDGEKGALTSANYIRLFFEDSIDRILGKDATKKIFVGRRGNLTELSAALCFVLGQLRLCYHAIIKQSKKIN